MGNDMRNVSAASKSILMNKDAIAVSQDPLGQMGTSPVHMLPCINPHDATLHQPA